MTTAVAVTPGGHDLSRWAGRRSSAERVELGALMSRMGGPERTELMVLAAHPDDETLGLGRLVHRWARTRGPVTAAVGTAGEACLDHVTTRPSGLAERRLAEWTAATALLGVGDRIHLDLPDGRLAEHEEPLRATIEAAVANRQDAARRTVLAAPWRHDPHPDHRAVGRVARAVGDRLGIPVLEYGVWMTYWADPEELDRDGRRLAVLNTDEEDERAFARACQEFDSQLRPLDPRWGPVVPAAMLAHLSEQLLVLPEPEGP